VSAPVVLPCWRIKEYIIIKNVDLKNSFHNVVAVSPRRHRVGVAIDLPRAVVIAMSVARDLTKDVRMLRRHVRQRDPQGGRSVDGQRCFELQTTELPAIDVRRDVIRGSQ